MKPDWQNKSYAKTSSPTAPSTMHSKLKVGMTSLHSKIAVSNHNMPSQPMPTVRKFADGGSVRTRSDDEIGDTDLRTGKVDPGSYDRRMAEGAKNMERLRSAADSIKSFFSGEGKSSTASKENESNMSPDSMASTYYSGKKDSDTAKPVEMKTETTTEPSYMKDVRDTLTKPKAESTMTMTEEPAAVKTDKPSVAKTAKPSVAKSSSRSMPATPSQTKETAAQMREKQVRASGGSRGARMREAATDTGDEMTRLRDKTSKSIPGVVGRFDLQGNQIPVGLGPRSSQVYSGDGSTAMSRAENRYLQSRIDAGNLTAMERAQAKRAGLI
jgi:hypothetical protein